MSDRFILLDGKKLVDRENVSHVERSLRNSGPVMTIRLKTGGIVDTKEPIDVIKNKLNGQFYGEKRVFVLTRGSDRCILGVYSSQEALDQAISQYHYPKELEVKHVVVDNYDT